MEHQIVFVPSPHLLTRLAKRDWLRTCLVGYGWWMAVPLLILAMCLCSGDISFAGRGGWMLGMLLGIVLTFVFLLLYSYSKAGQTIANAARKWQGVEVKYTFDEEGFSAHSDLSSSWRSWKIVQKAQVMPEALLLFFAEQSYVALPSEQITEDLRQFIVSKVGQAGGEVGR